LQTTPEILNPLTPLDRNPLAPLDTNPNDNTSEDADRVISVITSTPAVAMRSAVITTRYVAVGETVSIITPINPALHTEKKCYTPQEVVDITLGINTTRKDLMVYQALLKSYDLTIFTNTDQYMPQN
jgi:hypothetical protein